MDATLRLRRLTLEANEPLFKEEQSSIETFQNLLQNDPNDPQVTAADLMRMRQERGAMSNMKMYIDPLLVKEHLDRTRHYTRGTLKDIREAGEEVLALVLLIPSSSNDIIASIRVSAGNKYAFIPFHKNAVELSKLMKRPQRKVWRKYE